MRNSQYTFVIIVVSWFFFAVGCGVTAAYLKVSTQFNAQAKTTEAAEVSQVFSEQKEKKEKEEEIRNVETFIENYYNALEKGNRIKLLTMVEDPDTYLSEKKIRNMTSYIQKYNNLTCYIKKGDCAHSYIVFVSYETQITDISDKVPGMSQYYVKKEDNHFLIYNNKSHLNEEAQNAMKVSLRMKDIQFLIEDTSKRYKEIVRNNKKLQEYFEE